MGVQLRYWCVGRAGGRFAGFPAGGDDVTGVSWCVHGQATAILGGRIYFEITTPFRHAASLVGAVSIGARRTSVSWLRMMLSWIPRGASTMPPGCKPAAGLACGSAP